MENPYELILSELKQLRSEVRELKNRIPDETPVKRYSPQDLADATPLSIQTIHRAIKDGRIKAEKLGNRYLITSDEFNRACREVRSLKYKRG